MEQLRLLSIPVLSLMMSLAFTACKPGGEAPQQDNDDPELAAACSYIRGGGSGTTGGEGGTIVYVDDLSDDKDPETGKAMAGTLRYAVEEGNPRMILFRVAGTIHLTRPLELTKGLVTIAGQSAPGDGICVADYPLIIKNCSNVIVRFMRFRLGNESLKKDPTKDYDAISVNNCSNVVLDHCSASWSVDECVSCYGNENFTLQYCFVTEALRNAGHVKGPHGYGGIWGGKNATFHHNLIAHNDSRNPRFDHEYVDQQFRGPVDFVNNVVYNWGGNSTYGGEGKVQARRINHVANYYKAGPSTKCPNRLLDPTIVCPTDKTEDIPGKFYLADNYMFGYDDVTADNWKGTTTSIEAVVAPARWTDGLTVLSGEQTALNACETVLAKAGCSYSRDAVDKRVVANVQAGTGKLIDKPSDVGGWPVLNPGELPLDTDRDGIPDEWETAHGLNPKSFKDGAEHTLVSAHTNLECYLCDIVKHLY